MSKKTRKPTREELLKELESIRMSLLPDEKDSGVSERRSELEITKERPAIEDSQIEESLDYVLEIPKPQEKAHESKPIHQKENQEETPMTVLPGQQSLFDESDQEKSSSSPRSVSRKSATKNHAASEDHENPFLPQHIKERLEKEKSLYQKEIDAAAKMPGLNPYADKESDHEALIDELVTHYLPQIEQELRQRLKESLENSQEE